MLNLSENDKTEIMKYRNTQVKRQYRLFNLNDFLNWLGHYGYDEYIIIPENQTVSGNKITIEW